MRAKNGVVRDEDGKFTSKQSGGKAIKKGNLKGDGRKSGRSRK